MPIRTLSKGRGLIGDEEVIAGATTFTDPSRPTALAIAVAISAVSAALAVRSEAICSARAGDVFRVALEVRRSICDVSAVIRS